MRPRRRADLKAVLVVLVLVTVAGTGAPHARADTPQSGGRALPPPTKLLSQVSGADRRKWLEAIAIDWLSLGSPHRPREGIAAHQILVHRFQIRRRVDASSAN